jgi:hypothetical protein
MTPSKNLDVTPGLPILKLVFQVVLGVPATVPVSVPTEDPFRNISAAGEVARFETVTVTRLKLVISVKAVPIFRLSPVDEVVQPK